MNRMALPLHLLADIPGYGMLGQTAYGAYFRVISTWWLTGCPEIQKDYTDWQSLAGMRTGDYMRHKFYLEPLILKSIDILSKYREEKKIKRSHIDESLKKAHAARRKNLELRRKELMAQKMLVEEKKSEGGGASFSPVKPDKPFNNGFNLVKRDDPSLNKLTNNRPTLFDK